MPRAAPRPNVIVLLWIIVACCPL